MKYLVILLFTLPSLSFASQCRNVFSQNSGIKQTSELMSEGVLSLRQIERLEGFLNAMSESQKSTLFSAISKLNSVEILSDLQQGKSNPEVERFFSNHPGIDIFLADMLALGNAFPGIYTVRNSAVLIPSVLDKMQQNFTKKVYYEGTTGKEMAMASSLRSTIDMSLRSVIQSALKEYEGTTEGRSLWTRSKERVSRFFFPLHGKVDKVIHIAQEHQKQLDRILSVDSIVVMKALGEADKLNLRETEIQELVDLIVDTPKGILGLEQYFKEVFGEEFKYNYPVSIDAINIHSINKQLKKTDIQKIVYEFDTTNVKDLDKVNTIISKAKKRNGLANNGIKDYTLKELQIYYGAFRRQLDYYNKSYFSTTSKKANESYTVERRHVTYVKQGKTTKRIVTYSDEKIVPSYETLLSKKYDKGDRDVTGLDSIISRTKAMVKSEAPYREKIDKYEGILKDIANNHIELLSNGPKRAMLLNDLRNYIIQIDKLIPELEAYSNWTDSQIKNQYAKDDIKVFRDRNKYQLKRFNNIKRLMTVFTELIVRNEHNLYITFDVWDYTNMMAPLKDIRNRNYITKGVLGTASITSGTTYMLYEPFQRTINDWASQFPELINYLSLGLF